jgi:aryl-alcohol dehydrogenase-like predicted oxidoreductase
VSSIFASLPHRLGLGLAALGRPGYITLGHADDLARRYEVDAMRDHAHGVLDAAWAAGVRYFDAARSYGRAEEFLASWLAARDIPPADVVVGSKWGYAYTANWRPTAEVHEVKEHTVARLERQLAESRALLGAQLDLYQIHSATEASGVLENRDVLARLAAVRREGVAIGLTVTGPEQSDTIRRALDVRVDGTRLFDTVQATWNLLERSASVALAEARDAGLGVIVKEPLANGRLTERNASPALAPLAAIARRHGVTMDAVALAAVLAERFADVVLSGAATAQHLHSNRMALDVRLDAEELDELRRLAEPSADYWTTRSRLPWN